MILQQGERSPTSTGGTQYYQEWTSKHMRHLCSRFEKPNQQQLLMNVERKSKYPFIILCTPEQTTTMSQSLLLSKSSSSSCSSSTATTTGTTTIKTSNTGNRYHRELSHNSAYNFNDNDNDDLIGGNDLADDLGDDDCLDDDDDQRLMGGGGGGGGRDDHEHWITQKQRDSVNSHYLPPPPPPLLMPHIWPEIRYIDGLYTVCASIVRPGSGVPCEFDEYFYSDINNTPLFDQNHHQQQQGKHISFQDMAAKQSSSSSSSTTTTANHQNHDMKHPLSRPAGYIVSAFATFPGEDSDRLEKNWLFWTGKFIF